MTPSELRRELAELVPRIAMDHRLPAAVTPEEWELERYWAVKTELERR